MAKRTMARDAEGVGFSSSASCPLALTDPYHEVLKGGFDYPSSLESQHELVLEPQQPEFGSEWVFAQPTEQLQQ